jgi:hypothetical protein
MPLSISANAGNDAVTVSGSAAAVTVNTGSEHAAIFGLPQCDSLSVGFLFTATVLVQQDDTVGFLRVLGGSTVRIGDGIVLNKVPGNLIDLSSVSGVIDLAGGALLWRVGGAAPDFRTLLTSGRNGGAWNGTGAGAGAINSSLAASSPIHDAVGYGLGSEIAPTTIGPFAIAAGDTLVRYTLDSDADLNQQVNLADFNRLASNFGQTGRAWTSGDSNYDSSANLNDFNALAGNFGQAVAAPDEFSRQPIGAIAIGNPPRERLDELT